ncbi:hypothetical protein [Coxiella burnetii]|nr:hypothetical protein [Coxiella burnetii]MCF2096277.1 hypothetical protein [Coxiella burnetii]MCF2098309.1 hypothetical protein [Coxiella burnetii]MCF2099033.1 hypothetical protein [Coxiella burnetii]MCF2101306.1 hypothetical protein [Coxiella burnetii]MCF2103447.1 hypothetical protein [Coxiella burnetii]
MEGVNLGWSSKEIIFLFVVAAFSAIAFIFVERKAADPIVSLHLFTRKTFLSASLCLLFFTCAFSSSVFCDSAPESDGIFAGGHGFILFTRDDSGYVYGAARRNATG